MKCHGRSASTPVSLRFRAVARYGIIAAYATIWLTACAPLAYRTDHYPERAQVPESVSVPPPPRPIEPGIPRAAPVKPRVEAPSKPASPAIAALVREAEAHRAGGQFDHAAATLERAIRIQPRNAELWQQLAAVRLQQGQPGLAEDLAKKSNTLAQGNRTLILKNWALIAEARRLKGDVQGAADAEAKAAGH